MVRAGIGGWGEVTTSLEPSGARAARVQTSSTAGGRSHEDLRKIVREHLGTQLAGVQMLVQREQARRRGDEIMWLTRRKRLDDLRHLLRHPAARGHAGQHGKQQVGDAKHK